MVRQIRRAEDNAFLEHMRNMDFYKGKTVEAWIFSCDEADHPDFRALVVDGDISNVCCPECGKARQVAEERERLAREWRETLVKKYGVPADNANALLDGYEIREDEGKQVAFEDRLALISTRSLLESTESHDAYNSVRNVTICGKTGVGKSYLGAALINEVARSGKSCYMIQDSALLSQVLATWKAKGREADDFRKRLEEYQVLVIDDLDHERWHQAKCSFLADLLIARFGGMKQTLILTNRSKDELLPAFGSAVESRLKRGRVITVTGEDRRKGQKMMESQRLLEAAV